MKKFFKLLLIIVIIFLCIAILWEIISTKIIKNYNNQFLQYDDVQYDIDKRSELEPLLAIPDEHTSNVEGLIISAINNNKNNARKLILKYGNFDYASVDELNQLLNKLDTTKPYYMKINYETSKNGVYNYHGYIESISLYKYIPFALISLLNYEGRQNGNSVRTIIDTVRKKYHENLISYISFNNIIINCSNDNLDQLLNLRKQIQIGKLYNVEIQSNNLNTCNIIISDAL